jgi:RNA polymerase sigma-70 factor (ECF subfamily)
MDSTSLSLLEQLRLPSNQEAWKRFVLLYTPLLEHWARREGLNPSDCSDLTQEVLLKLTRVLPDYQRGPGQTFRGWLLRVTQNQCRDFLRRKATRPLPNAEGLSAISDPRPLDPQEEAEDKKILMGRALELIRGDFAEATFTAFQRVAIHGERAATVAAALGMTENAVYLARHRVMTRLRQELEELIA